MVYCFQYLDQLFAVGPFVLNGDTMMAPMCSIDSMDPLWISLNDSRWKEVIWVKDEMKIDVKRSVAECLLVLLQEVEEYSPYIRDQRGSIILWVIGGSPWITTQEAENVWRIRGIRQRILEGRFHPIDIRKSANIWLIHVSGLIMKYGLPKEMMK
ncbi:hypothetical protein [Mechercharimyces sp. CAU 1602]|uniref:hypothetical protein n=1 Tax=Mechercharimyces sp. CAU 1602 TaxID=2973933 RepID=UPI0021628041|nr:hypothetical protein [Mechercharimyces sp. CAU 1602]MCS1352828.1 hypothetical protein [Mechercharimyces sp. CAU 1602]